MTKLTSNGIFNFMCLCMKFSVNVLEVVSVMDNFTDTTSLHFQTR